MTRGLEGARVIITGVAGDIGAAVARRCYELGARQFLLDRSDALETLTGELDAEGATVSFGPQGTAAQAIVEGAAALGGLDGLVHAAGVQAPRRPLLELDPDDWQRLVDVNLSATLGVVQAAAKEMDTGSIVNIGSISGTRAIRTTVHRLWLQPVIATDPDVALFRTRHNLLDPSQRQMLQDVVRAAGFLATSDPPMWLDPEEREELVRYFSETPQVEWTDRYCFGIDGREVDVSEAVVGLPPTPPPVKDDWQ
jgi:hypothetical protein